MQTAISALHIIICVVLIILVLLQAGREGMGVIFGGGNTGMQGASSSSGVLVKLTAFLAALFIITSLVINIMISPSRDSSSSVLDVQFEEVQAPFAPEPAAPADPALDDAAAAVAALEAALTAGDAEDAAVPEADAQDASTVADPQDVAVPEADAVADSPSSNVAGQMETESLPILQVEDLRLGSPGTSPVQPLTVAPDSAPVVEDAQNSATPEADAAVDSTFVPAPNVASPLPTETHEIFQVQDIRLGNPGSTPGNL